MNTTNTESKMITQPPANRALPSPVGSVAPRAPLSRAENDPIAKGRTEAVYTYRETESGLRPFKRVPVFAPKLTH